MAFETGTATSETDLLVRLDEFLTGNAELVAAGENWTRIYSGRTAATSAKLARQGFVWSAPGTTGGDSIFVGASTQNVISSDTYNLYFCGGTFFNAELVTDVAVSDGFTAVSPAVGLFAAQRGFSYWFFASGRRFIVITTIDGVYSSAYCGFILPIVTPAEYPYPLLIAGTIPDEVLRYSTATESSSAISDARDRNCWLLTPVQTWEDFYGQSVKNTDVNRTTRYMTPAGTVRRSPNYNILAKTGPGDAVGYPLHRVFLCTTKTGENTLWGALDGVHWLPGIGCAPEDVITTPENQTFIVYRNAYRTGNSHFFAVRRD